MKIILILVIWPGTWLPAHEVHLPFDTWKECESARSSFKPDERAFLVYCTKQDNETWVFESQKKISGK